MSIPQADRKRLLEQIEMGEQYQKKMHTSHCSKNADCITHCTTCGLIDPKCPEQHCNCSHPHNSDCPDCINIICTLDEIRKRIKTINNEEIKMATKYDFDNASQHIVEWSRHNLRAAQQNDAKNKIISQMKTDEAFCIFDWGQEILPQEFRERQNAYFEKAGMSVLVGSFVWKNQPMTTSATDPACMPSFNSESYILALTNASQTELDSLSGSEIIIKQFKEDHKHVKNLHKRTDNAGSFSSHAIPEVEQMICDRLSLYKRQCL